jgi:putative transcriptional regulator
MGVDGVKMSRLALYATLTATLLSWAPLGTTDRSHAQGPPAASLTGQLLVALPELDDPRFTKTVIYMVKHDARGAVGVILNRPLGDIPIAVLLKQAGLPPAGAKGSVKLHVGGPVEATRVSVLHSDDYKGPETSVVAGGIALTSTPEILQAIAAGKGPRQAHFNVGFAGWGPGQLEGEIKNGAWLTVPADSAILFDDAYETKWDRAMAKRRINL